MHPVFVYYKQSILLLLSLLIDTSRQYQAFDVYLFFLLLQNQPIGYIISSILATDRDTGTNGMVTYGFLNEDGTHFTLQPDGDGALLLSNFIADREKQDRYTLVLLASDGSDTNKRETPLELTILITDENDNEPFFIRLDENTAVVQFLNITEHSSSGTSTGTVNQASDLDLAPFNNIYYYIVGKFFLASARCFICSRLLVIDFCCRV